VLELIADLFRTDEVIRYEAALRGMPLIHVPARLRLTVTLAALPHGDTLSFTRLQDMLGLTPGNLITHLRKLEDTGYVQTERPAAASTH
jgi:DNA-binding MarR family transcriptional regulator